MKGIARLPILTLALAVATILVAPTTPALAHVPSTPTLLTPVTALVSVPPAAPVVLTSAAPGPAPVWPLLAFGAVIVLAAWAVPRRVLALVLIGVLTTFAVQAAVHSVHHMADAKGAAHCGVSLASAHVYGAGAEPPSDLLVRPAPLGAVASAETVCPGARPLRPDEGRAPPA